MNKSIVYLTNRQNIIKQNDNNLFKNIDYNLLKLCQNWGINLIFTNEYPCASVDACCCIFIEFVRDILLIKSDILILQDALQCSFNQAASIALLHELGHFQLFILKAEQSEKAAWLNGSKLLHLSNIPQYLYNKAIDKYCN